MRIELGNTEVPYVHANSLTGHANERGSEAWPTSEENMIIFDSTATFSPVQELPTGTNEPVVDPYSEQGYTEALLAVLDLPPLPPSPDPEDTAPIVTDPVPQSCCDDGEQALANPDSYFKDELALFQLPPPAFEAADEDIVDVAMFVAMGHSPSCGCTDCAEPPELLSADSLIEDDGWMVYSSVDEVRSPSVCSAWEWEWCKFLGNDEDDAARPTCYSRPAWDDVFPCTPSTLTHGPW